MTYFRPKRVTPLLVALALVLTIAGCTGSSTSGHGCAISTKLVPSCGVLVGIESEPSTNAGLADVEATLDTRFTMVHRFHDLDDPVPTEDEKALVADGRILQLSLDPRFYSKPDRVVTWSAIAAGTYDSQLAAQAHGIASLGQRVFITFAHEPDVEHRSTLGTPAQFVAAWRHVHDLFAQLGTTNVVWVWVVTGSPTTEQVAASMWPGNQYVDWISWESYNSSGCRADATSPERFRSFDTTTLSFLRYLRQVSTRYQIDTHKPIMISEAGSVVYPGRPDLTARWYRQIPPVLKAQPQIKALSFWDHSGQASCDYRFDQIPAVRDAVRKIVGSSAVLG